MVRVPHRHGRVTDKTQPCARVLRGLGFECMASTMSEVLDLSPGMTGGIGEVTVEDATRRTLAFCTHPASGWQTYDLAGAAARAAGHFDQFAPWSLFWADALAGRLSVADLAGFTHERREELTSRLAAVRKVPLAQMEDRDLDALTIACQFGYRGVWAPKITKMLALYRPESVPVLDGYVAMAMGFARTGFSEGKDPRWERIRRTLKTLRAVLRHQGKQLDRVRDEVRLIVPDIDVATDLRLLDIIVWTSQDDRLVRPGSPVDLWLQSAPRDYRPDDLRPTTV